MGEFRRIIGTRKYFLLAILLIAANLVIFQYSERHTLEIMSDVLRVMNILIII